MVASRVDTRPIPSLGPHREWVHPPRIEFVMSSMLSYSRRRITWRWMYKKREMIRRDASDYGITRSPRCMHVFEMMYSTH